MNHQAIIDRWVQRVVIDLGLCPFAWQSIHEKRLHKKVILASSPEVIYAALMDEIIWLEENKNIESALLTVPNAFETFEEFLDALDIANQLLADAGFEGIYQFAAFHPQYQFAGTEKEDPSNYTNRSPFPVFHPIRESAMTAAIDAHPDIDSVPKNNIEKTQSLGIEHMRSLFHSCFNTN